ncbi:MAG: hypothetical protein ACI4D1_01090 [Lachnospira sp.]
MRHIRKHPVIIGLIVFLVLSVLFIAGYIDVNIRFPQPKEELYEEGQWVDVSDGLKIMSTGIEYCTPDEYRAKYDSNLKEGSKLCYILVHLKVKNNTNDVIDFFENTMNYNLVIYPSGYNNQAMPLDDNTLVKSGEVKDITLVYNVSESLIWSSRRDKVFKEDIYLCFKAYPVRQAILFRGIDR